MLYGSVHVDPAAGWFPHVVGHADETGAGAGLGATRNLPLPAGARATRLARGGRRLADWVAAGCDALVVSLGVDAAADDPESPLLVTADGYRAAGAVLGATGLPAVVVQEGGYHLPTLGALVAAYLEGHAGRRARPRTCECDRRGCSRRSAAPPATFACRGDQRPGDSAGRLVVSGGWGGLVVADDPGELAAPDLVAPHHDRLGVGPVHGQLPGR